jgi:integrase
LLTDLRIRKAKPKAKPYRLFDGDGLYLRVSPTGARSWQLRYQFNGKDQLASLGKLDLLSLAEARVKANEELKRAAEGVHLTAAKRTEKLLQRADADNTFGKCAEAWLESEARRMRWTPDYRSKTAASLHRHLDAFNDFPMGSITAVAVAPRLRALDATAPAMANKVRGMLRAILDVAVEDGVIPVNPLPAARRKNSVERKHHPAVTDLPGLGAILRTASAADTYQGVARAHQLLVFTALRIREVAGARWEEFELDGVDVQVGDTQRTRHDPATGNWSVPRERMKRKNGSAGPHVVPLPPALLAALRVWRKEDGAGATYVCRGSRKAKIPLGSEMAEKFYRVTLGLDGKHSPHSWRSAFSTVCREAGKEDGTIEAQLDHVVGNSVASAYDRARRLELRRELMRWYEGQLIAARDGAVVVPIGRQSAKK